MTPAKQAAQTAREEYRAAEVSGADWETRERLLRAEREAVHAAETPEERARRLRTKAIDLRASYARHMDDYGEEIGRATFANERGETVRAALARSAAQASLDCATEKLIQAEACEREADSLQANGFVTLFDGVSARVERAA